MDNSIGCSQDSLRSPPASYVGSIVEQIVSGQCEPLPEMLPQIALREFASGKCGAKGMSTGTATFEPGAALPYHRHVFGEAVTVLAGAAFFSVEGRSYRLRPFECIHVPAGVAHGVVNASGDRQLLAHCTFAAPTPSRELVKAEFVVDDRAFGNPRPEDPEHITRLSTAKMYELADGARFCDLFAGRFGAVGICGGYGEFRPGSSLPCHIHEYDESITIVTGEAICEVMGQQYRLRGCDTAYVPQGRPHRFLNKSQALMAMVWVYAGSEPARTLVDAHHCLGTLG